jgi:hypothetical protein
MKNEARTDRLALARRIRAAGCPVSIAEDDGNAPCIPSDGLRVYQTGGVFESSAFDWAGGTGFKIYLVVTNLRPTFAISAFELELPWKNDSFYWLEDPLVIGGPSPLYRFGGAGSLEFERSLVINHYADVRRTFSPGQSLKGFLLGFGFDSIPADYPHGAMIPAFLVISDQLGAKFRSSLQLWVDRSKKNLRRPQSGARRKGGLLDNRDAIARN